MALTKPPLSPVSPGQPVTAQGWNDVLTGVSDLFDALLAFGTDALSVRPVIDDVTIADAIVVAVPDVGQPVRAVPPFGDRTTHTLVGLTDGNWTIHVQAPGFEPKATAVVVPQTGPVVVELTRRGSVVPDLFGVGLRSATDRLRAEGLDVDVVLDTTGREVPRTAMPPEYVDSPVLVQSPAPGGVAPPDNLRVRLVVASPLRRDPVVTMPSLIGLTSSEAAKVLERLGLVLGTSTFQTT